MATRGRQKNTVQNSARSGLNRDASGRVSGGNPGNSGGKPGRSGRKPNEFVRACEALADTVVLEKVAKKLRATEPDDPTWRWCAEYVSKYAKTEAPKRVIPEDGQGGPARFTLAIGNPLAVA